MVATTWIISKLFISFTKDKNAETGEADQLVFNRLSVVGSWKIREDPSKLVAVYNTMIFC